MARVNLIGQFDSEEINALDPYDILAIKMFERAIRDIMYVNITKKDRKDAKEWLLSNQAFILGSWLFGMGATTILQNWVREGCPDNKTAWRIRGKLRKRRDKVA